MKKRIFVNYTKLVTEHIGNEWMNEKLIGNEWMENWETNRKNDNRKWVNRKLAGNGNRKWMNDCRVRYKKIHLDDSYCKEWKMNLIPPLISVM